MRLTSMVRGMVARERNEGRWSGVDFPAARRMAQSICDGVTGDELRDLGFEFNGFPSAERAA